MKNNTKRPPGLIRQERVVPNNIDTPKKENKNEELDKNLEQASLPAKKTNINQQRNIKISTETKKQIDILLKFSNHKFAYELIDSMIDVYIEHALDNDQRRAYKTLSKLLSE